MGQARSPHRKAAAIALLLVLAAMPLLAGGRQSLAARAAGADRLAFVSLRAGEMQICSIDADGQGERRLTRPPGQNVIPVWSPDGRRIAFISSRAADLALWVMDPDGRNQRRLAPVAGDFSVLPVFSWKPR